MADGWPNAVLLEDIVHSQAWQAGGVQIRRRESGNCFTCEILRCPGM
jgi:hypothetical protein